MIKLMLSTHKQNVECLLARDSRATEIKLILMSHKNYTQGT